MLNIEPRIVTLPFNHAGAEPRNADCFSDQNSIGTYTITKLKYYEIRGLDKYKSTI